MKHATERGTCALHPASLCMLIWSAELQRHARHQSCQLEDPSQACCCAAASLLNLKLNAPVVQRASTLSPVQELVFGWPVDELERQALSVQAHQVRQAVGLKQFPVATPLKQLSGGYKRRVALAVQLVRRPAV